LKKYTVRVGFHAESEKSIGILADVIINPETGGYSASRLEWFPKSLCEIEKKEIPGKLPEYYLTAPEWLLKDKKVNFDVLDSEIKWPLNDPNYTAGGKMNYKDEVGILFIKKNKS
jgi:hypothetical protein